MPHQVQQATVYTHNLPVTLPKDCSNHMLWLCASNHCEKATSHLISLSDPLLEPLGESVNKGAGLLTEVALSAVSVLVFLGHASYFLRIGMVTLLCEVSRSMPWKQGGSDQKYVRNGGT